MHWVEFLDDILSYVRSFRIKSYEILVDVNLDKNKIVSIRFKPFKMIIGLNLK